MMRRRRNSALYTFVYKPACILMIVAGLFGLVWLRSNFVSLSYDLRGLEVQKQEAVKDQKLLQAERSKLMALANIDGSLKRNAQFAGGGFVFPDRVKVIYVQKDRETETRRASLPVVRDGSRP